MKMKKFTYNPVEYQIHIDSGNINKDLAGAVHVETYTKEEGGFFGDKTITVFAFYPDDYASLATPILAEVIRYFVGKTLIVNCTIAPIKPDKRRFNIEGVDFCDNQVLVRGEESTWISINHESVVEIR